MISQEIRRKFLAFFKNRSHTIVPSSPVIPHHDPTLLFINAGMNQFKDVFLAKSVSDYKTAASCQKCIRVGGKHNDLENVGHTSRHLTFFEMMGNFSFGDYFKKKAIDYAWELTLEVFGFDPKDLWATVFYEDEESFELWKSYLPEERIVRMGEKDNFWAMGETGPCGPCSELYLDRGAGFSHARSPAEDVSGERFLEFWNLVFMEFDRQGTQEIHPLPKKSIDTGVGLERVISLKMGVSSLFETDILRELIAEVEKISGKAYDPERADAPLFRVIADHLRALCFACADGVQPSNIDRGYVLRKVLRRAVRYGRSLGLEKPFLTTLVPRLVSLMGEDYPELKQGAERIKEILFVEEENFQRTLKRGGNILNQIVAHAGKSGQISGEDAFKLKDTYGLPLEEIMLLAKDSALGVDIATFETLEHEARERSRGARKAVEQKASASHFESFLEKHGPTQFVGYHELACDALILGLMRDGTEVTALYEGESGLVLLDKTAFYAEKGGQLGDIGTLASTSGQFAVAECKSPFTDVTAHSGIISKGELHLGDRVWATVDAERRSKIARNHTATHLLHWALREVCGPHVKQAGSVVEPNRLRFDFNHHKALDPQEIEEIENLVNTKIRENCAVHVYELPLEEAQANQEIIQFFGEKYGRVVRVVDMHFSKELCGGTHLVSTGQVGTFRIAKEGSIAAGVRRIEAVTGQEAELLSREEKLKLKALVEQKTEENRELLSQITRQRKELLGQKADLLLDKLEGGCFLLESVDMDPDALKECADLICKRQSSLILVLIGKQHERCTLIVRVSSDWVSKGIKAGDLLKEVVPLLDGKGGGRADAAQGSGTRLEGIALALEYARKWLAQKSS